MTPSFPMTREHPLTPPPGYAEVRDAGGLARVQLWDGRSAWLVTGYDEVRTLLRDPRVSADRAHPGFPFPSPGREALERSGQTFITMDGADHRRLRLVFTKYFSVKRIEAQRAMVQAVVDELVDDLLGTAPPLDLIPTFALEVPARAICRLLGMRFEDRHYVQALDRERNMLTTSPDDVRRATDDMLAFTDNLIAEKEQSPGDDLVSQLVTDHLVTGEISREELVAAVRLLITAGHETTANMIALSVATLLQNPEQLRELRTDPALMPNAVEELLRYISIFHISPTRVALEPIEIGGHRIESGDGIITAIAGANHDPSAFPDPEVLDMHRNARHHVAFGYGVHQCLGQPLARIELQVALETLTRRIPSLRLAVPPEDLAIKEYAFLSLDKLPVTWDRSSPFSAHGPESPL